MAAAQGSSQGLEAEIAQQIAEGMLPATVEQRLIRQGHPEDEVRRLIAAERERIAERQRQASSQAMVGTAKGFGLVLIVVGILLPWSVVSQGDLGFGDAGASAPNGFSPDYFVYGIGFLALVILSVVLMLFTRERFRPDNTRDRVVFGLSTFVQALVVGWWVFALLAVNRSLGGARENIVVLGDLAGAFGASAHFGMGIFLVLAGALLLLVVSYFEIVAVGGETRIQFKQPDDA